ncbi:MAG: SRPBCC family protein [Solirubrobacteraceae bacterium]
MARLYDFLTTWRLDAPIDSVWEVLHDAARYTDWWPGVRSVTRLEPGEPSGAGSLARYSWSSTLPYTLTFDVRVTRVERPGLLEGSATGELEGTGTWRLYAADDGGTTAVYHWRVRATKRWMRWLDPLLRPLFVWSHNRVMSRGAVGLRHRLAASG